MKAFSCLGLDISACDQQNSDKRLSQSFCG